MVQRNSDPRRVLETKTGVGHDVGFLSFPFMDELALYVLPFGVFV